MYTFYYLESIIKFKYDSFLPVFSNEVSRMKRKITVGITNIYIYMHTTQH